MTQHTLLTFNQTHFGRTEFTGRELQHCCFHFGSFIVPRWTLDLAKHWSRQIGRYQLRCLSIIKKVEYACSRSTNKKTTR